MSVSDMEKDLEFVLAKLRSDHPTVREKGFTLSQLDVISSVRQNICVPLSKRDFWFQLQRVFAMMNESHTTLSWMQWDDELYLNLPFRWLMDDGMVIVKDSGGFRKGDQIVSIGGRSPAEILDALWEVRASENEYWIRHSASYTLTYRSYLSYLGVVNPDNTVNIEVLRDGELLVRRLPFGRIYYGVLPSVGPIQWHIEEDNNLGYFRFDFWPSEADMGPLADALADFFSAVKSKGIDNVVFDWRNTEANYSSAERTLLSYLDTGRVYSSGYDYISHEKKPEEMLFRGKVYVLTSPGTDGSALRFVTTLHDNGVAVTVGEPTGQAASFAGPKLDNDPLPVTGWTYRIATKTYMRPRGIPNEVALFPDVPVYTTREDIIAGRDAQMEKLREIISGVPEVTVTPVTTPEIQDWTNGELPPYIREFWYVERFHYFIVIFNQPILELDPSGIRVTDASGRDLELRSVPNLTPIALDTVTISPREWVDEDDTCIITLPAGAVLLQDGSTNPATLRLGKYDYQHYP